MRKVILILLLITPFMVKGQTIPMDSAKYFEVTIKTVCRTVTNTDIGHSGAIFINFGKPFHLSDFTAVIFANDTAKFTEYKPCVSGTIKIYKGKPEIIVKSPDQIRFPEK